MIEASVNSLISVFLNAQSHYFRITIPVPTQEVVNHKNSVTFLLFYNLDSLHTLLVIHLK